MKRHRPLLQLLPVIAFSTSLMFSQSSTSSSPQGELRFAAVVLDSSGNPIRDLRSDDFTLQVLGKPQALQVQAPTPPAESTSTEGRGLVVVVIDTMHTRWGEQKDVRLSAGKYLADCAKRNVPVSLMVFSREGKLVPVHEYTTTSATLAAALERADAEMRHQPPAENATPEVAAEASRLLDFYKGQGAFPSQSALEEYPGAILRGFKMAAQYVARIPGRKSLIWVSSTFPFAVEEKQGKILSPTTRSLAAGDLIYPNLLTQDQVRQLQVVWEDSIGGTQSSELALYPVQTRRTAAVQLVPEVINSMTSLAHMTGGVEVHTVGDFFGQFANLPEQSRAAYELTIAADANWDCKSDWCPMRITVNRPGAHVLAPQGFFRQASLVPQAKAAVAQASTSQTPGPETIPFTVNWKPAEDAGQKKKIAFVVSFGPSAGIPGQGSAELDVEVMVHAFSNGTDKQGVSFGAKAQLPPARLDEIHNKGFALNNSIELEPGDYEVRFVVHDKVSGRLGVLKLPLKVG